MKMFLAVLLLTGSVMANDSDFLKAQIMQGADALATQARQNDRDREAIQQSAEASVQSMQQTASIVNAINAASAQSTVVAPYQPIPVR